MKVSTAHIIYTAVILGGCGLPYSSDTKVIQDDGQPPNGFFITLNQDGSFKSKNDTSYVPTKLSASEVLEMVSGSVLTSNLANIRSGFCNAYTPENLILNTSDGRDIAREFQMEYSYSLDRTRCLKDLGYYSNSDPLYTTNRGSIARGHVKMVCHDRIGKNLGYPYISMIDFYTNCKRFSLKGNYLNISQLTGIGSSLNQQNLIAKQDGSPCEFDVLKDEIISRGCVFHSFQFFTRYVEPNSEWKETTPPVDYLRYNHLILKIPPGLSYKRGVRMYPTHGRVEVSVNGWNGILDYTQEKPKLKMTADLENLPEDEQINESPMLSLDTGLNDLKQKPYESYHELFFNSFYFYDH